MTRWISVGLRASGPTERPTGPDREDPCRRDGGEIGLVGRIRRAVDGQLEIGTDRSQAAWTVGFDPTGMVPQERGFDDQRGRTMLRSRASDPEHDPARAVVGAFDGEGGFAEDDGQRGIRAVIGVGPGAQADLLRPDRRAGQMDPGGGAEVFRAEEAVPEGGQHAEVREGELERQGLGKQNVGQDALGAPGVPANGQPGRWR